MKFSIVLIILIMVNTSALIAEPIMKLLSGVNTLLLVVVEAFLIIGYYINYLIKDLQEKSKIDFNNIKVFITKQSA